jgi:hypothetical protein
VTEQDNMTSGDVDDVIMNEENVTTNVTHGSHVYDGHGSVDPYYVTV